MPCAATKNKTEPTKQKKALGIGLRGSAIIKLILSFILGAASSYAMAPWHIVPLIFLGLSGLYVLLHRSKNAKAATLTGLFWGFGYFGVGLSWISNALLVEDNPFRWVWPLALLGMPLMLSPFLALTCGLFKRFCITNKFQGFLAFTVLTLISEFMRGYLFTGFPWNLFGYSWGSNLAIIQIVSLYNIYLLSGITIFWAALPGFLWVGEHKNKTKMIITASAVALFACTYQFGNNRLNKHPTEFHENTFVKIVQPNIPLEEKWNPAYTAQNYLTLLKLSEPENQDEDDTTFIIWPETAISPRHITSPDAQNALRQVLQKYPGNVGLITGALRYSKNSESYHNSIIFFDKNGNMSNIYDKSHLVPFGEYIPLENIINIAPLVGFSGFSKGKGPASMATFNGLIYTSAICYEIIFPGKVIDNSDTSPDFIVNVSNDAWFGNSAGPEQHFEQAKFRAIEEGIPVVRSANTGISGVFDPLGRTIHKTKIMSETRENIQLPKKIALP